MLHNNLNFITSLMVIPNNFHNKSSKCSWFWWMGYLCHDEPLRKKTLAKYFVSFLIWKIAILVIKDTSNCLQNRAILNKPCPLLSWIKKALRSRIGREASWPMRIIETFSSKQRYLYLSLADRKVVEFQNNIDRRRYLVW